MHSGDPVTNSGWLQYFEFPPNDIRMVNGSGTFSIAPLDTQRIIYAIIVGYGESRLTSVSDLKRNTNFIRDVFHNEFKLKATAAAEVDFISESQAYLHITAHISGEVGHSEVKAELYGHDNFLFHTLMLYDDGQHNDGLANDNIFGNTWLTAVTDNALYLNLKIPGVMQKEYLFQHCVDNITLIPNRIAIASVDVVADHLNEDGKLNPGETARLNCTVQNNFTFDIGTLNVWLTTDDPYISIEPAHLFLSNITSGKRQEIPYDGKDEKTYFTIYVASDVPDTHTIYFDVSFFDDSHHIWHEKNCATLKLAPLQYVPNQIIPSHISGHSSAQFVISVMQPDELTGHSYAITVSDISQSRQGFNLIDQTLGDTLLSKQLVPEEFAFNIPVTDGFKIIEAVLPKNEVTNFYEDAAGGHPNPFRHFAVVPGNAPVEDFCDVELEFTDEVDSSGVIGTPSGQSIFMYTWFPTVGPTGFIPSPFNVWKIENGQRGGQLNVCLADWPSTRDGIWSIDDLIYIMATEYDSSGQYYYQQELDPEKETLYRINFGPSLVSDTSVIDVGDKIFISRTFKATNEDVWTFIPTNVKESKADLPGTFALHQNYPNPFNPTTTIRFSLEKPARVSLNIYNILGQEIIALFDKELSPGIHSIQWDGKNAAGQYVGSGLYFARLTNRNQTRLMKMLLIR